MTSPRWYALQVHARKERAAADELARRGFQVYLPVRTERRVWSDRIQRVETALFPGYAFVRASLDVASRREVLKVKHAFDFVGRLPGDPAIARAIPDREMLSLQRVVESERTLDPVRRLVRGTHVVIAHGPLRGTTGVVEEGPDGRRRLVVQIALLGRGVRTVLSADDVLEDTEPSAFAV